MNQINSMHRTTTRFVSFILIHFLLINISTGIIDGLSNYDRTVLKHSPVGYWPLNPNTSCDFSRYNLGGQFSDSLSPTLMPNGDSVVVFNGINQSFTIEDSPYLEIVRTGVLSIEAWFRPDTLQFPKSEGSGYVWWMGKGSENQQSWAARMYNYNNTEGRYNRISGYVFNKNGGLGSGSYFQDTVTVGQWIFYTLIINTVNVSSVYPSGYVKLFKNGVQRDQDSLLDYNIIPQDGTAPMRIGTRQFQSFFKGAIGKVAVFDYELNSNQLTAHFNCMTKNMNCTT